MVKKHWALITGGGSGIGQALAVRLANTHQLQVLAIGRNIDKLKQTQEKNQRNIEILQADVSEERDRRAIAEYVSKLRPLSYVVHNAAVLQPVKPLRDIGLEEWRQHFAVNVEGPLFLTQKILPFLKKGSRILHISSGAAHHAYAGWGAYCTSKAALHMLYHVWNRELNDLGILVGSLRPGVVNTPMQDQVRQATKDAFPALDRFIQLKEEGKLLNPDTAAQFIAHVLLDTEDLQFAEKEWDIREHAAVFGMEINQ